MRQLEIACCNIESVINANTGGATRIELFENMLEGGCTPSYGMIQMAIKISRIPIYVMIRPRGGDFMYSKREIDLMLADIEVCQQLGADGIVFGILDKYNGIAEDACRILLSAWGQKSATFHRAFDLTKNLPQSTQTLVELGFERVLTSGGKQYAEDGLSTIIELQRQYEEKISIMAGSGITIGNVSQFSEVREIHATCKKLTQESYLFGGYYISDLELIRELRDAHIKTLR